MAEYIEREAAIAIYEDAFGRVCTYGICVDCTVPDDFFCASSKPKEEPHADDHD